MEIEDLPEYLSRNPTCCVLLFNDGADRPDFETTDWNFGLVKAIQCERIPWTTVDLKVGIHTQTTSNEVNTYHGMRSQSNVRK